MAVRTLVMLVIRQLFRTHMYTRTQVLIISDKLPPPHILFTTEQQEEEEEEGLF